MNKNHKIIITILILIILIMSAFTQNSVGEGYEISIYNNTDKNVNDLNIEYKTGGSIYEISNLKSKSAVKYNLNTNTIGWRNSILLSYKDGNNEKQSEFIIDCIGNRYKGHVNVFIDRVDEDGILKVFVN